MYEQLIEKLIKKDVSTIGANVVDDTEDIVIPVSVVPPCESYYIELECVAHGCYWWGDACHSEPEVPPPPDEFPWLIIAIVAGVSIIGAVAFAMFRK